MTGRKAGFAKSDRRPVAILERAGLERVGAAGTVSEKITPIPRGSTNSRTSSKCRSGGDPAHTASVRHVYGC